MSYAFVPAAAYLLMSLLTYAVYAADKTAARQGRQRVPERTLHLLALFGGWPGALLAQQRLRHKTRKAGFQLVFWLIVFCHAAVLFLMLQGLSPDHTRP